MRMYETSFETLLGTTEVIKNHMNCNDQNYVEGSYDESLSVLNSLGLTNRNKKLVLEISSWCY